MKILIVDDEVMIHEIIEGQLRMMFDGELEFEKCADFESALQAMKGSKFDLVTCDVKLHSKSGIDLVIRARNESPTFAGVPVIFITGYKPMVRNHEILESPHTYLLGKPFSMTELSDTLAQIHLKWPLLETAAA